MQGQDNGFVSLVKMEANQAVILAVLSDCESCEGCYDCQDACECDDY